VSLFEQIAQRGAVLSEYPIDAPPAAENFPRRNRIVSGMSRGVLVIEGDERSGALITARQACDDHARPVFALPGRIDNKMSIGPHLLIRDGATLVTGLQDIIDGLGPLPTQAMEVMAAEPVIAETSTPIPTITLTDQQKLILSHLGTEAAGVDQIMELSGLEAPVIMSELTILCLKGAVRRMEGQTFALPPTRSAR
jgi:DNA processing protein